MLVLVQKGVVSMISKIILLLAAVHVGSFRDAVEERCLSVGLCSPTTEPTGNIEELCSIYLNSLGCIREAVDACRKLPNLPKEFVAVAEEKVTELRVELDYHCSDINVTSEKQNPTQTQEMDGNRGASTRPERGTTWAVTMAAIILVTPRLLLTMNSAT